MTSELSFCKFDPNISGTGPSNKTRVLLAHAMLLVSQTWFFDSSQALAVVSERVNSFFYRSLHVLETRGDVLS